MRRSILDAFDDHPADDDERPPASWAVAVIDDCDGCGMGELRVVLTLEEVGRPGAGVVAHLAPDGARGASADALGAALREIGEDPGRGSDMDAKRVLEPRSAPRCATRSSGSVPTRQPSVRAGPPPTSPRISSCANGIRWPRPGIVLRRAVRVVHRRRRWRSRRPRGTRRCSRRCAGGPPAFMKATMAGVNVNENWVHHEDARRGQRRRAPPGGSRHRRGPGRRRHAHGEVRRPAGSSRAGSRSTSPTR